LGSHWGAVIPITRITQYFQWSIGFGGEGGIAAQLPRNQQNQNLLPASTTLLLPHYGSETTNVSESFALGIHILQGPRFGREGYIPDAVDLLDVLKAKLTNFCDTRIGAETPSNAGTVRRPVPRTDQYTRVSPIRTAATHIADNRILRL
jgi:hypothetical protein